VRKELELWQFVYDRLARGENVILLVVAESSGSSPGRAGYKMAVATDGQITGSIGGGVMEVNLVEEARNLLSEPGAIATGFREQVHQRNSPNASGMICSGRQTVIIKLLTPADAITISPKIADLQRDSQSQLTITHSKFQIGPAKAGTPNFRFDVLDNDEFFYEESLDTGPRLYIIGGGHCALALSELISKLDFHVTIFDDRSDLNTIEKNTFADRISIIDDYENLGEIIPDSDESYAVVMTLGYASDKVVIRQLCGRDFKYFGVLGSIAKMATLLKELREEGVDADQLARIRTPIGLPINSRTPEEIAVSITAEIIAVKNSV
jgi:xanthine dehydrogenase accessory factor